MIDSINSIRNIILHPCPQNTSEPYPYVGSKPGYASFRLDGSMLKEKYLDGSIELRNGRKIAKENCIRIDNDAIKAQEPLGLLSLTTREDNETPPVTKAAVVDYIEYRLKQTISQINELNNLQDFIRENKNAIGELLDECEAITIDQFPLLGAAGLKKLLNNPVAMRLLLGAVHIEAATFIKLDENKRVELINHSVALKKLAEASISWREVLQLTPKMREFFYYHAEKIGKLIAKQQTTFAELKQHESDFDTFIDLKLNSLNSAHNGGKHQVPLIKPAAAQPARREIFSNTSLYTNQDSSAVVNSPERGVPIAAGRTLINDYPAYITKLAENTGLSPDYLMLCHQRDELSYNKISMLSLYLANHRLGRQPALNLEAVLALTKQEMMNLHNAYRVVAAGRMTIQQAKQLSEEERRCFISVYGNLTNEQHVNYWMEELTYFRQQGHYRPDPQAPVAPQAASQEQSLINQPYYALMAELFRQREQITSPANPLRMVVPFNITPVNRQFNASWLTNESAAFLSNGNVVTAEARASGLIRVVDPINNEIVNQVNQNGHQIELLCVLPNNQIAACQFDCKAICIYDLVSGSLIRTIPHAENTHLLICINQLLIATSRNVRADMHVYDINSGHLIKRFNANFSTWNMVAWGNNIAVSGCDRQSSACVRVIDPLTGSKLREIPLEIDRTDCLQLLNGNFLAIAGSGKVLILNLTTNTILTIALNSQINVIRCMATSKNGYLLLGDSQGNILEYNYVTGERLSAYQLTNFGAIISSASLQTIFNQLTGPEISRRPSP